MDAFYAAVEEKDNPSLRGRPVIVGGSSKHGIVTTANYIARKFGIHSAMPIFMAKQRCPNGVFVPGRMKRYQEISRQVFQILYEFTDQVEPLSIDEAYLDISHIDEDPLIIIEKIKERVRQEIGLTMSVGLSYNKFLAKLASEWNKPDGLKIITREMVPGILLPLPIRKVYGIGPKSAKRLNDIAIYTIEDLLTLSEEFLFELLGKSGLEIYNRIRGIDPRVINTVRERKSLGIERTFIDDTDDIQQLMVFIKSFSYELASQLEDRNLQCRTVIVKIKDCDFRTQTRSKTLNNYISSFEEIYDLATNLLHELEITKNIRLLGITASNLMTLGLEQLSLFD